MRFVTLFLISAIAPIYTTANVLHQQTIRNPIQSIQGNQSRTVCEKMRENDQALREIKNVHEFLEKCLKKSVLKYTLNPLTKPGDNYNSVLQSLEVKLIKNNDSAEVYYQKSFEIKLRSYAKLLNFQIEMLQLVCKRTPGGSISASHSKQFLNEIYFYSNIIPAIKKFEEDSNIPHTERIDAFVQYFGSRLSLDSSKILL